MKLKLALIFISLLFFGCSEKAVVSPDDDKKAVTAQIERFHKLYNERNFEQIADDVYNPEFLKSEEKDSLIQQYEMFYQKYGKMKDVVSVSEFKYYSARNSVPFEHSRYIAVFYTVNYENGSNFSQPFIFSLPDEPKITTHRIHDNFGKIVVWN